MVGQAAVNQEVLSPDRTIRSAKRRMGTDHGRLVDDPNDLEAGEARALRRSRRSAAEGRARGLAEALQHPGADVLGAHRLLDHAVEVVAELDRDRPLVGPRRRAADGDEVEALREALIEALEHDGLIPGEPGDPDPWCTQGDDDDDDDDDALEEDGVLEAELVTERPVQSADLDLEACRVTFDAVLGAGDRLRREAPAEAATLAEIAREGREALERRDLGSAGALFDRLSDRMFELGVYL